MKKLPKGINDFRELRKWNCIYVDKTEYIYKMVEDNKYIFLSRPRRFGKSLTVSVLEYLFRGEKELFEGTWIYDKWNWESFPVVRLDVNKFSTETPEVLKKAIDDEIFSISSKHDIELNRSTYDGRFYELIQKLSEKYNKPVVLLIDEYEKPILDHITDKQKAHQMREILRQLYGKIKSLDQYLRFVFLTGVTKYTKAGVFSTLNNLADISLHEDYSQMLGYTLEEIKTYFFEYIQQICRERGITEEYLLEQLEKYYGGFSFDGKNFVFNPFAVLLFFFQKEFLNYWSQTAQPSFLYNYLRTSDLNLEELLTESQTITVDELLSREIESATAKSFLVQAGYLTFKEKIDVDEYIIGIPNLDAGSGLTRMLMEIRYGINYEKEQVKTISRNIRKAIANENVQLLMESLKEGLGQISYGVYIENELTYEGIIMGLLIGAQIKAQSEREVSSGRIDIVIQNNGVVYIIELKIDKPAKEALEQIKNKRYYEGFKSKKCYLIGVSIDSQLRNIKEWEYELIKSDNN